MDLGGGYHVERACLLKLDQTSDGEPELGFIILTDARAESTQVLSVIFLSVLSNWPVSALDLLQARVNGGWGDQRQIGSFIIC